MHVNYVLWFKRWILYIFGSVMLCLVVGDLLLPGILQFYCPGFYNGFHREITLMGLLGRRRIFLGRRAHPTAERDVASSIGVRGVTLYS